MLCIQGSPLHLCQGGWTRREMLRAGGLGTLGLNLADFFRLSEAQAARSPQVAAPHFGKAKSCILLFLYGSPSQIDTFDPKPEALPEIRGEFGAIQSSVPGALVGELLPATAKVLDKVTVLRSMSHGYPEHGAAYAMTGNPVALGPLELNPRDGRHWPFIGSVVDFIGRQSGRKAPIPDNLALPFPFSSRRVAEVPRAGPYAAFLGNAYNPIWTEFRGEATAKTTADFNKQSLTFGNPYLGIRPDGRFELASAADPAADLTLDRLNQRRSLSEQFDSARRDLDASEAGRSVDRYRALAYDLIRSPRMQTALDVQKEPMPLRESYGMSLFGQSCLAARRLVEAGSRFVTVFWDEYGVAGSAWDTHYDHHERMKDELCPGLDRALHGLSPISISAACSTKRWWSS